MRLSNLLFFFAASVWATEPQIRDTTAAPAFNIASVASALNDLTANATATGNFGNISPPPRNLLHEVMNVVPGSVYWDLLDPNSRRALASQISAGSTPTWYHSLPTEVKAYMTIVRSQIAGGALTATTGLAYETTATDSSSAGATGTAGSAASSTSKGVAPAAQPTGLTVTVAGALSVLGVALVL